MESAMELGISLISCVKNNNCFGIGALREDEGAYRLFGAMVRLIWLCWEVFLIKKYKKYLFKLVVLSFFAPHFERAGLKVGHFCHFWV